MNVKKIILAASTLIMVSTLSTGVMAKDTVNTITHKEVAFGNDKGSNFLKFFKKGKTIYVAGIYMQKDGKPGTWMGRCNNTKEPKLTCNYITNKQKTGTINFDLSNPKKLTSKYSQSNEKDGKKLTWLLKK